MATETMTTMTIEQPLDGVLVATLNRPDRLNAMTNQMFDELEQLALRASSARDLRALIMTGAGTRVLRRLRPRRRRRPVRPVAARDARRSRSAPRAR